jgi:hypothetical protein
MLFSANIIKSAQPVQLLTINTGTNFVLTSHSPFTDLSKGLPIIVTLTGVFYATNTSNKAFDVGDLSTWLHVTIKIGATCDVWGCGGAGGASVDGAGLSGGPAFDVNSNNSSTNLTVVNDGDIGGGGGGGGGGAQVWRGSYVKLLGKENDCDTFSVWKIAGGGGGGGGISGSTNSSGGAGTSTGGGTGGAGTISARGDRGARGYTIYQPSQPSSTCSGAIGFYGQYGGYGGLRAAAGGAAVSGVGGAAGTSLLNQASCDWTNNGTVH